MRRSSPSLFATFLLLALVAPASTAHAATSPPGVNLRWDQCYADGGAHNKTFACDTNSGFETLVGSFELAQPSLQTSSVEIRVDLRSASPGLPAWWAMRNAGTCRQTALSMSMAPPVGATNCVDWANGSAAGGIAAYNIGSQGPDHARLLAAVAVPVSGLVDLQPGQEYFLFRLSISHTKTVGTGACAGCDVPVCIFFSRVKLTHADPADDFSLDYGANYLGSQYVTWQNGYPIDVHRVCDTPILFCRSHYTSFSCVPYDVTPATTSTWGQVKSLYR